MVGQVLQGGRTAIPGKVFRGATNYPTIAEQLDRYIVRVGYPANADAHVVALANQIDEAVGEVERELQVGKLLVKPQCVRGNVNSAKRSGRRNHQVAFDHGAAATDIGLHVVKVTQQ
ncbi:hypothetical protein D3C78_1542310 [compost metagenome]